MNPEDSPEASDDDTSDDSNDDTNMLEIEQQGLEDENKLNLTAMNLESDTLGETTTNTQPSTQHYVGEL